MLFSFQTNKKLRFSEEKRRDEINRDTTLLCCCLAAKASSGAKKHPRDITVTPGKIYSSAEMPTFNPQLTRGIRQNPTIVLHQTTTL